MGFSTLEVHAKRTGSRGRASRGLVVFVNRKLYNIGETFLDDKFVLFVIENLRIVVVSVYLNQNSNVPQILNSIYTFFDRINKFLL